jgi:uncharacterized protein
MAPEFKRLFEPPDRSFFLFGPRGVGKSYWLRRKLADAVRLDLLNTGLQLELAREPGVLEARVGARPRGSWVWLDEVQKVPSLLDEVHRLIEERGWRFALSGSSARKLLRQGANLLAGRASTRYMEALSSAELGTHLSLQHALEWGTLPLVVNEPDHAMDILTAYVHTYIREEVREEGLVRKIEPFLRFLDVAGAMNGQELQFENIAREAAVPRNSVVSYFSILEDTLMAHRLPAYQPRVKVRERAHSKFYWFDPGVARAAAGLLRQPADPAWLGFSLETLIYRELRVRNHTSGSEHRLSYYRTPAGTEIDFIVELARATASGPARVLCIEVKSATRWNRKWEDSMRSLAASPALKVERMIGIYRGRTRYHFDGVDVMGVEEFLRELHGGGLW